MSERSDPPGAGGEERPPSEGEWFRYHPQGRDAADVGVSRGGDPGPQYPTPPPRAVASGTCSLAVFALLLGMGAGYVRGYFASGPGGPPGHRDHPRGRHAHRHRR